MAHIIVLGNAIDGLNFIGPFGDKEDALDYAGSELNACDWHVVELANPDEDDEDRPKGMDRITYGHLKARGKL